MPETLTTLKRAPLLERLKAFAGYCVDEADMVRPPGGRDARLDMFRGLALVMIFINHVPGTFYETLTSRNFGFSDAAEAFVFMSGLAAGLASKLANSRPKSRDPTPISVSGSVWSCADPKSPGILC